MFTRGNPSAVLALSCLWFLIPSALSQGVAFQVKAGTTAGGCDGRSALLSTYWTEINTLIASGLAAFDDAANGNNVARQTLTGYLGITPNTAANDISAVRANLQAVQNFYNGQGYANSGGHKPFLFCSSDWLQINQLTDFAKDSSGQEVLGFNARGDLQPLAIQDIPRYQDFLFNQDAQGNIELGTDGKPIPTGNFPYWSDDLKEYIFAPDYQGNPPSSYCGVKGSLGGTQTGIFPNTITLCPLSFTNTISAATLGSRRPGVGTNIQKLLPRSVTLLHETFHLVLGTQNSIDASYDLPAIQAGVADPNTVPVTVSLDDPNDDTGEEALNTAGFTKIQLVRQNPETYVFFCVAYWYAQQTTFKDSNGNAVRYSFANGRGLLV